MDVRRIRNSRGWIEGTGEESGFAKPSHEPNVNYRPMLMNLSLVKRNELREESFFLLRPSIFSLYRTPNNSISESSDFSIQFFFFSKEGKAFGYQQSYRKLTFPDISERKIIIVPVFLPKYNFNCCQSIVVITYVTRIDRRFQLRSILNIYQRFTLIHTL